MFKGLKIVSLLIGLVLLSQATPSLAQANPPLTIKIMTLNLHNGKDAQKQPNLTRLAGLIASEQPDILALQEVQRQQLENLKIPGYRGVSGPNANYIFFRFGNALLTRHQILYHRHHYLPSQKEQRGVDEVAIAVKGQVLRVLNTHIGLGRQEQQRQIDELARISSYLPGPLLITGDFNLEPTNRLLAGLAFQEVSLALGQYYKTFPAWQPTYLLDQIWCSHHFSILRAKPLAWDGSDHLPVVATLALTVPGPFPLQPVVIPDPTLTHNPLLPDIGLAQPRLSLALAKEASAANQQSWSGWVEVPFAKRLRFTAGYQNAQTQLAATYLKIIDLRDYFSYVGIRGKAEWGFTVASYSKRSRPWLEWSQYYRWSNRWGSKFILANGDQKPAVAWEQSYLPNQRTRLMLGIDSAAQFQAGIAYAPNRQLVLEVKLVKNKTATQYVLGWEHRFG